MEFNKKWNVLLSNKINRKIIKMTPSLITLVENIIKQESLLKRDENGQIIKDRMYEVYISYTHNYHAIMGKRWSDDERRKWK